ncbi:5-formyltetrahydrofolate cyclo-ligase, mitochondrial-like isoform X1 [Senna tora]|uniref:5-formyltetrahydrofolate cyclo-ligase, mitochondrial-like isoform X1 n=1 Tax=Senna tora TaxID=362788 RepID=A0A834W5H5_9FABA|nr:5-formyltetrahydrofolate cyclo-ligase, mitochondrial-like isoform X1 [Senna tora]
MLLLLRQCRTVTCEISMNAITFNAAKLGFLPHPRTIASPAPSHFLPSANMRTGCTMNTNYDPQLDKIFEEKRSFRTQMRKELKKMDPIRRSQEGASLSLSLSLSLFYLRFGDKRRVSSDDAIQRVVLEAPWFKNSSSICAYISSDALREVDTSKIVSEILSNPATVQIKKKLYVPRVEDRNSNMRMLKISRVDDLVLNSMNILEPTLVDSNGNPREDVMQATDPVDLIIIPGLAFDRSGRRLGRSGGYYDMFLKKYLDLVKKQNWKQPLLVALSYSIQITENERIAVTPYDVAVDALLVWRHPKPYAGQIHQTVKQKRTRSQVSQKQTLCALIPLVGIETSHRSFPPHMAFRGSLPPTVVPYCCYLARFYASPE